MIIGEFMVLGHNNSINKMFILLFFTFGCIVNSYPDVDINVSPKVIFGLPHGLYECDSMSVSLLSINNGLIIRYTIDGSDPSINSPIYTKPLTICKSTIIKAVVEYEEGITSEVYTSSYLLVNSIIHQKKPEGYPSTWGNFLTIEGKAPADYDMDETISIPSKDKIVKSLYELPIVSLSTCKDNLFSEELDEEKGGIYVYTGAKSADFEMPGHGWERPVSLEIFGGKQQLDLTVNACLKLHGGSSRIPEQNPKHAFRVHFKSKYGPSKLNYNLFGEDEQYNALVLRTFYNFSWQHCYQPQNHRAQYTRDMWARYVLGKMGWPTSRGLYVHLFLNGLYWGIYNLSERIDDVFCKEHWGGKKSDYDVIKADGGELQVESGNINAWNQLLLLAEAVGRQDETSKEAYDKICGVVAGQPPLLDINNFIDYMLLNYYCGNTDWDFHNWYAVRSRENPREGFKLLNWDSECIFTDVEKNVTVTNNEGCPTFIFNNLIKNDDFRRVFSERANYHFRDNHLLTPEGAVAVWDSLYYELSDALFAESARWGDYRNMVHPYYEQTPKYTVEEHYMKERNMLHQDYFPYRTSITIKQLKEKNFYSYEPTKIVEYITEVNDDRIFNLQGMQLYNKPGKRKDLYIINGRKYIVGK